MSEHQIILTADGSHSILSEQFGVTFHSRHGALQESQHVFIASGLIPLIELGKKNIKIVEAGFGTGSTALLSSLAADENEIHIEYIGLEAYPLSATIAASLNYGELLDSNEAHSTLLQIHQCPWEELQKITPYFSLKKRDIRFAEFEANEEFDLVFFDAFGPGTQPELWTTDALAPFIKALKPGGILTTYSAKGDVRRSFQALGCVVEKIPGPPGKREMLRATKV